MKKILAMLALVSSTCMATEVFSEYYVMEKVLPYLTKAQSYSNQNGEEVKAVKVDWKILKALKTTSDPFYFTNYAKEKHFQSLIRLTQKNLITNLTKNKNGVKDENLL